MIWVFYQESTQYMTESAESGFVICALEFQSLAQVIHSCVLFIIFGPYLSSSYLWCIDITISPVSPGAIITYVHVYKVPSLFKFVTREAMKHHYDTLYNKAGYRERTMALHNFSIAHFVLLHGHPAHINR